MRYNITLKYIYWTDQGVVIRDEYEVSGEGLVGFTKCFDSKKEALSFCESHNVVWETIKEDVDYSFYEYRGFHEGIIDCKKGK